MTGGMVGEEENEEENKKEKKEKGGEEEEEEKENGKKERKRLYTWITITERKYEKYHRAYPSPSKTEEKIKEALNT